MQSSALISGGHSYSEVDIRMSMSMTVNLCFLVSVWARVSSSKNILCLFPFNNSKCLPVLSHNCMPFFFYFSIIFFILNPTLPLGRFAVFHVVLLCLLQINQSSLYYTKLFGSITNALKYIHNPIIYAFYLQSSFWLLLKSKMANFQSQAFIWSGSQSHSLGIPNVLCSPGLSFS